MRRDMAARVTLAIGVLLAIGCDDGGGETPDVSPVDARPVEPDQAAAGCERNVDCLAAEYCDREAPAEASDAEPPLGMCVPGCRIEPDTCPAGRMCSPVTRMCVGDCLCEPGDVDGCDGEAVRVCADDCLQFVADACSDDQRCMDGECRARPEPMPDMAPPEPEPDPDMAPPEPEPDPDMAPPEPEPDPDMAPPEPEPDPDMAPPEPQPDPDMAPPEPQPDPDMAP